MPSVISAKHINYFCAILFVLASSLFAKDDLYNRTLATVESFASAQARIGNSSLKKDCSELVVTTEYDWASAVIKDKFNRFEWLLFQDYYHKITVDSVGPSFGLNLKYRPSEDQNAIFPAWFGLSYDYPASDLRALVDLYISVYKAIGGNSYTELRNEPEFKYNYDGWALVVRFYYGSTYYVYSCHLAVINGVNYMINYLTDYSDYSYSISRYYYDLILSPIKLQNVTSKVEASEPSLSSTFSLSANYPNPFNASTTFKFSVEKQQRVRLDVFDITGRLVTTVMDTEASHGEHEVKLDASALASGYYFYVLSGDENREIKKMMLIK